MVWLQTQKEGAFHLRLYTIIPAFYWSPGFLTPPRRVPRPQPKQVDHCLHTTCLYRCWLLFTTSLNVFCSIPSHLSSSFPLSPSLSVSEMPNTIFLYFSLSLRIPFYLSLSLPLSPFISLYLSTFISPSLSLYLSVLHIYYVTKLNWLRVHRNYIDCESGLYQPLQKNFH